MVTGVPGGHARPELAVTRFANVRWVDETGSTNSDLMERARQGDAEGAVRVADHQSAGRGRAGRVWTAPPGAGLLMSILLRPPAEVMDSCTMAVAVSASEAIEEVAGFAPRLQWPNDTTGPGEGYRGDRTPTAHPAEGNGHPRT